MRLLKAAVLLVMVLSVPVVAYAQEDDPTYEKRLELARQMHEFRSTRDQVYSAIDQVAESQPEAEREAFRTAMRQALNYKAIEKISLDAMTEIYTVEELQAMIDYYSKPEAASARAKDKDYAAIVYPEIIRMLDKTMMQVKTGGTGP